MANSKKPLTITFADDEPVQKEKTGGEGMKITYADPPPDISSAEGSLRALEKNLIARQKAGGMEPGSNTEKLLSLIQSGPVLKEGLGAFVEGLSANFSDEGIAWLTSSLGYGDDLTKAINNFRADNKLPPVPSYDVNLARERKGLKDYRAEHPGRAAGYNLAGAFAPSLLPILGQLNLIRATGTALATGAATGFGSGEGRDDRVNKAAVGGAISAAATPAIRGAGKVLGAGWRAMIKPGAIGRGQDQATQMVRRSLGDDALEDGIPPAEKIAKARADGKPMALGDVGPNTRGVMDAAHIIPGPGKAIIRKFLVDRDAGMIPRMTEDLKRAFGKNGRFFPEFKSMSQERATRGGKIYDRANKKIIPMSNDLAEWFKTPAMVDAIKNATTIAKNSRVSMPNLSVDKFGRLVDDLGDPVRGVSTQFLHYIKMGLDDSIYSMSMRGLGPVEKATVQNVRHGLLGIMDKANPTYRVARNYWAGKSASMDAMKKGREFLKADIDELGDDISKMGKGELDAFRVGVMQGLTDNIEKQISNGAVANNLVKTTRNRKLIRQTFAQTESGTKQYKRFIKNLSDEIEMKSTSSQVQGNSATIARKVAREEFKAASSRPTPVTSPYELISRVVRQNSDGLSAQQEAEAAKQIAKMLTETDPAGVARILKELESPGAVKRLLEFGRQAPPVFSRAATNPVSVGLIAGDKGPDLPPGLLTN